MQPLSPAGGVRDLLGTGRQHDRLRAHRRRLLRGAAAECAVHGTAERAAAHHLLARPAIPVDPSAGLRDGGYHAGLCRGARRAIDAMRLFLAHGHRAAVVARDFQRTGERVSACEGEHALGHGQCGYEEVARPAAFGDGAAGIVSDFGGGLRAGPGGPATTPIYTASSYFYESMEELDRVFGQEDPGYCYARYDNPTNAALEEQAAALESGHGALACSSGMAAIHMALLAALADRRKSVLAANALYGATVSLLMNV